jgi:hypothetical protein
MTTAVGVPRSTGSGRAITAHQRRIVPSELLSNLVISHRGAITAWRPLRTPLRSPGSAVTAALLVARAVRPREAPNA